MGCEFIPVYWAAYKWLCNVVSVYHLKAVRSTGKAWHKPSFHQGWWQVCYTKNSGQQPPLHHIYQEQMKNTWANYDRPLPQHWGVLYHKLHWPTSKIIPLPFRLMIEVFINVIFYSAWMCLGKSFFLPEQNDMRTEKSYPSGVIVVPMYAKHRNRDVQVLILVVHPGEPKRKTKICKGVLLANNTTKFNFSKWNYMLEWVSFTIFI